MLRTLIHVDDPEHRDLRGVTSEWFLPKNLAKLEGTLDRYAKRFVDRMSDMGGQCDFARDIAMVFPLNVILSILGLPESDDPRMLTLTQEMFGVQDEDMQRGGDMADLVAEIQDFFAYFSRLTEDRRANPTATGRSVTPEHGGRRDHQVGHPGFDVGRSPNKHLLFGFGVHHCLGEMLARMELKVFFRELLPRLRSVEIAGEPKWMKTIFVGGLKTLPIRYEMTASR